MDEKITIIEGPTPEFEPIDDGWALGLNETSYLYDLALTKLRTFNGNALVERCHNAWKGNNNINLHYRNPLGMEETAPILAARSLETNDGQVLLLWVRRPHAEEDSEVYDDADDTDWTKDDEF